MMVDLPQDQPKTEISNPETSKAEALIHERRYDEDHPSVAEDEAANPRNWSAWKKRLVFLSLMSSSILADGYVSL